MSWSARFATALTLACFGCAQETQFVQVGKRPPEALALRRVAVAPFRASTRPGATALREDAAPLVTSYVADALAARGLEIVPPSDVAQGLDLSGGTSELGFDPGAVARVAHQKFGVDAVAAGRVYRFRERSGEALGSVHPASVGFEVRILEAPSGRLLWQGIFDETQVALAENLLRAPRYPGGGTRWLSAEEFARWGAGEVAQKLPLAPTGP
jgi:hypothetical protein